MMRQSTLNSCIPVVMMMIILTNYCKKICLITWTVSVYISLVSAALPSAALKHHIEIS